MRFFKKTLLTTALLVSGLLLGSAAVSAQSVKDKAVAEKYNAAKKLLDSKDYEGAQNAYKEAVTLAKAAGEADIVKRAQKYVNALYYNVALGYVKAENYDKAMALFNQGITARPEYAKNYQGKAQVLKRLGRGEESLLAYLQAADIAKTSGKIADANKSIEQAQGFIAKAMEEKKYDDAQKFADLFLEKQESADVYFYLCVMSKEKNKLEEAIAHGEKALELEKRSGTAKAKIAFEVAESYEKMGNFDKAIENYKMASVGQYKQSADYKLEHLGTGGR